VVDTTIDPSYERLTNWTHHRPSRYIPIALLIVMIAGGFLAFRRAR
jgi:hypothetical protein